MNTSGLAFRDAFLILPAVSPPLLPHLSGRTLTLVCLKMPNVDLDLTKGDILNMCFEDSGAC